MPLRGEGRCEPPNWLQSHVAVAELPVQYVLAKAMGLSALSGDGRNENVQKKCAKMIKGKKMENVKAVLARKAAFGPDGIVVLQPRN